MIDGGGICFTAGKGAARDHRSATLESVLEDFHNVFSMAMKNGT